MTASISALSLLHAVYLIARQKLFPAHIRAKPLFLRTGNGRLTASLSVLDAFK